MRLGHVDSPTRTVDDHDVDRNASFEDGCEVRPAPGSEDPYPHKSHAIPRRTHPCALSCARSERATTPQEEADQLAEFDFKKLKTSELVMLGGALAVFIGTFLTWYKAEAKGLGFSASDTVNGFHYFLQGTIPWILAIAIAAD